MARGLPSRAQFDLGLVGDWSNMGLWYPAPTASTGGPDLCPKSAKSNRA